MFSIATFLFQITVISYYNWNHIILRKCYANLRFSTSLNLIFHLIIANGTSNNNQTTESNIIDIEDDKEITNDIILQDIRRKHVIGGIQLLSLSFIAWSIYIIMTNINMLWWKFLMLGTYVHPQRPFKSQWADHHFLKNDR